MEEWRDVPGYEGLYQISISTNEGKCRSLNYRAHNGVMREMQAKPNKQNYNRIYWTLTKNGKSTHQQAARWIAITYPELVQNDYFDGAQIDHIDGDALNNHPSNLRWATPKENMNNPITKQHHSQALKGYKHSNEAKLNMRKASPKKKKVARVNLNGEILDTYESLREAERQTGFSSSNICLCCKGLYNTIGGTKWIYV